MGTPLSWADLATTAVLARRGCLRACRAYGASKALNSSAPVASAPPGKARPSRCLVTEIPRSSAGRETTLLPLSILSALRGFSPARTGFGVSYKQNWSAPAPRATHFRAFPCRSPTTGITPCWVGLVTTATAKVAGQPAPRGSLSNLPGQLERQLASLRAYSITGSSIIAISLPSSTPKGLQRPPP